MDALFEFISHYWWLVFVFGGSIGAVLKTISAANSRRIERRQERYRIKQQTKVAVAQAKAQTHIDKQTQLTDVARAVDEHDQTDARWFGYETNLVTLLDFPMMTDMREPLTVDFHKTKRRADLLRPDAPESMVGNRDAQVEYRDAVHAYAIAFDIAETEAKRRRRSGFSPIEQERLARAQRLLNLAMDDAATAPERQNAYMKARKELEGLIVLPVVARSQLERRIAAQIEA
ncbi:hypothetical protein [Antrihabitans cavernicola]|uniref:Uncharacterized protein n=1 Tax=Antrihabitans cavernicola TaxID=2495913 RepID=A0A5A7S970_9NOCA|nr:hypothetical protein [Spelaeibacter cavernicola]KAA0021457.1 hypothetical protein FOY51_19380 [Spelaeibacter cavernicola]